MMKWMEVRSEALTLIGYLPVDYDVQPGQPWQFVLEPELTKRPKGWIHEVETLTLWVGRVGHGNGPVWEAFDAGATTIETLRRIRGFREVRA